MERVIDSQTGDPAAPRGGGPLRRLRASLGRPAAFLRVALVAACAVATLATAPASQAVELRTADGIRARWQQLKPVYAGSPYLVTPNCTSPYSTGSLRPEFVQDGLNMINYARYVAGLPDDVSVDAAYASSAQHGAVLLAAGVFAHWQPKPPDMEDAFYQIAVAATGSSNIGWGYDTLWAFNLSGLNDDNTANIDRVGHRRWLLNPGMLKTGMGYASRRTDTFAFDSSRVPKVAYDMVRWPSAGAFPVEMFGPSVPWSVTLDPSVYSWTAGTAGHTAVLRRTRDGKTWTFTSADTNTSGEYFNFNTDGYGVPNCFIFRPDPASVGAYQPGDVFEVTLSGGITRKSDGMPVTISYTTRFITQESVGDTPPDMTPPVTTSDAKDSYEGTAVIHLTATDADGTVALTEWRLDGGPWTRSMTVSTSGNGTHVLEFRSADAAGNVEIVKAVTFTVWSATAVSLKGPSTAPAYRGLGRLQAVLKTSEGDPVRYQAVVFERWTGRSWLGVGSARTDYQGVCAIYAGPLVSRQTFRARLVATASYHNSVSNLVRMSPRAYLSNPYAPSYASTYRRFTVVGYLKPRHESGSHPVRIYRWRYVSGAWKAFGYVEAVAYDYSTYTRYVASTSLACPGRWRLRAYAPPDSGHAATWSNGYDYVVVR